MAIAALTLAGAGCRDAASPAEPVVPPVVRVVRVAAGGGGGDVTGVGTIALRREAQLGFTSPGRIARLDVNEGDEVHSGQLLAALDTTTVAADAARVAAERDRAVADYRRSATLLRQGWITAPRVESARAAMLAAEAQASAAGFQRANARIVAPGAGTVLARLAEPGQVVAAGTPVLVVGERASGYVLKVPLSDRDAARVRDGANARVTLAALGGVTLAGRVIEVAGRGDRATGTFLVEIALPADPRLRSGQIGDAAVAAVATSGVGVAAAATVPAIAVFAPRAGVGFVYVVDRTTHRVRVRRVATGDAGDAGIPVTAGLRAGEWVATSRVDRLADGAVVTPLAARR